MSNDLHPPTDYAQALNERLAGTMAGLIGMQLTCAELRRVAGEFTMRPDLAQLHGYMHGGALMTFMDTLAGMGSSINVGAKQYFLTIELKINFMRSVRAGRVLGEATAVHIGRRTHVWQVTAHDEAGRQLGLATLTQLVLEEQEQ